MVVRSRRNFKQLSNARLQVGGHPPKKLLDPVFGMRSALDVLELVRLRRNCLCLVVGNKLAIDHVVRPFTEVRIASTFSVLNWLRSLERIVLVPRDRDWNCSLKTVGNVPQHWVIGQPILGTHHKRTASWRLCFDLIVLPNVREVRGPIWVR